MNIPYPLLSSSLWSECVDNVLVLLSWVLLHVLGAGEALGRKLELSRYESCELAKTSKSAYDAWLEKQPFAVNEKEKKIIIMTSIRTACNLFYL